MKRALLLPALVLITACASSSSRRLVLRYRHSGQPAARVVGISEGRRIVSDSGGRMALPPNRDRIRIVDPDADDTVLFDGPLPEDGRIVIAEAVRVAGNVTGGIPQRVRIGAGKREHPLERSYRSLGLRMPQERNGNAAHLPLPASPPRWHSAKLTGTRFESGWIAADGDPQVVAFDASGRAAVHDVALPAPLLPRQTIDAGAIELLLLPALDVDIGLPRGDLPIALTLGVARVDLGDASPDELARYLGALDQIDRRLFRLLITGAGWPVAHDGTARLRGLPPFAGLTLVIRDVHGGRGVERAVALRRDGVTAVRLTLDEISGPRPARTASFAGTVLLEVTRRPVGGARVVVSDPPLRRETVTDFAGRFRVEGIHGDRSLTVFVDGAGRRADGHVATQVFRRVDPAGTPDLFLAAVRQVDGWPRRKRTAEGNPPDPANPADESTPPFVGIPLPTGTSCPPSDPQYGSNTSWVVEDSNGNPSLDWNGVTDASTFTLEMNACKSGTYQVFWAQSAFTVIGATATLTTPKTVGCNDFCSDGCFGGQPVTLAPLSKLVSSVTLQFLSGGAPQPNLTVWFSPPPQFNDYDATPLVTNSFGSITLCDLALNPATVNLYVQTTSTAGLQCTVDWTVCKAIDISNPAKPCQCSATQ